MLSFVVLTNFYLFITVKYVNAVYPKWPSTYRMNSSTIIMACNYSGPFDENALNALSKFGIVDIDWSHNRELWANTAPMTCQQSLLSQATIIKKRNLNTKVFVYRNLAKALPWFTNIRQILLDNNYADWFLKFKPSSKPYHVPQCTNTTIGNHSDSKCSLFYHDQEHQTPEYPKICHKECDCGKGIPCGEYLYDHRNQSLRKWLTDIFILNSFNNTGLLNANIDGFYIDDSWQYHSNINSGYSAASACNNYNSFGGPTEIDPNCIQDMGLTSDDVKNITFGWQQSMSMANNAIVQNNGFEWKLFEWIRGSPDSAQCSSWIKKTGSTLNDTALLYAYSVVQNMTQTEFEIDLAIFLLVRGPYAWLGYGWSGCHSNWIYQWNEMLDIDYGVPVDPMFVEVSNGVFQRKWSKYIIQMDCNRYKPTFTAT